MKHIGIVVLGIMLCGVTRVIGWDSSIVYKDGNGRMVYVSDDEGNRVVDFSHAGYHAGEQAIPNLPVVLTVSPGAGDDTARIQSAINTVAAMTPDANGHRGAILLTKGTYEVSGIVYINASGIVLRGQGQGSTVNDTIVVGTGADQKKEQGIILIESATGGNTVEPGTTRNVISEYIPAGSRAFEVDDASIYSVGDHLVIRHDPTEAWLEAINYGNVDGDEAVWVPGQNDLKMYFHGTITAIHGNQIKFDTPIYHALDRSLSQAVVYRHSGAGLIKECGVENMRIVSQNAGGTDESHRWDCVHFIGARNCWAKDSTSIGFAESGFRFSKSTRSTVLDCAAIDPVSTIQGGRRYNFYVGSDCHDILFKGCYSRKGRHCFVSNGTGTTGGIVFSQGEANQSYSSSESHRRWGEAILWDDITWSSASASTVLAMHNRGNSGTSHGWTGTGFVAWNVSAPGKYIMCSEPPIGQNYAIGCNAHIIRGNYPYGFKEGTGQVVSMPSLYEAQLAERLTHGVGPDAPARVRVSHSVSGASSFAVLEWNDLSLDESAYVIERSSNGGNTFAVLTTVAANVESHTDTTVAADASYVYRVKAVNAVGASAYGNTAGVDLAALEWPAAVTYQAEDNSAQSGASIRWDRHGFTGSGYVDINGGTTWFETQVDGGMGGLIPITFRYGAGETYDRPCGISVNGTHVATGTFTSTGSWEAWDEETVMVQLERGVNTLRIQPNGGANGPNFDRLQVHAIPTVYAAGETASEGVAENAFDGEVNSYWEHRSPHGSWIQFAQVAPLEVVEYSLTSSPGSSANDPRDWTLYGSPDGGASWTVLDTRSSVLFTTRGQTKTFSISGAGEHALYRLEITSVRDLGAADSIQLAEFRLTYAALPPVTPNPAAFAEAPAAASETAISMTAREGYSVIGSVQYYFDETTGNPGGSDSGWINTPSYTDSGLNNNYSYTYTVTMRDLPSNETVPSASLSARPYKMSTIVWNGGGASDGQWATDSNWTGGAAPIAPEQYKKVVFNVPSAKECVLGEVATVGQLVMGDNGASPGVRLIAGARLTAGYKPSANPEWTGVGYNQPTKITVETGAKFETAAHCHVAFLGAGTSYVEIHGGVVDIATFISLGNTGNTSYGIVNITAGGRLECASLDVRNSNSKVDIREGGLVLDGNQVAAVNTLIGSGKIVNSSAVGALEVDYDESNAGQTTVRAMVNVPVFAGLTQADAEAALAAAGLGAGTIVTVASDTTAAGVVMSQDPSGGLVEAGGMVNFVVSLGPMPAEGNASWRGVVSGDWTDGANWSGSVAPINKIQHLKVVFNGATSQAAELDVSATLGQLVLGDNGAGTENVLRLVEGADLTAGLKPDNSSAWTGIGYNRNAELIVESGANFTAANHLWIGHYSPSVARLVVDGGRADVSGQLGLGWNTGTGYVTIKNGGILNLSEMHATDSIKGDSVLDIAGGQLVVGGDYISVINNYIAAGKITAYQGHSTVWVDYNAATDQTTAWAEPFGYDAWVMDWEADLRTGGGDYDLDGVSDVLEYALNGDPTDPADRGMVPRLVTVNGQLVYVQPRRTDDPLLTYSVEMRTDLQTGDWVPVTFDVLGSSSLDGGVNMDVITNSVPTALDSSFIRMHVEMEQ